MTKKDVIISIRGRQYLFDEPSVETIDLVTSGVMTQNGQDYIISYFENDIDGTESASTTLTIQDGRRVTLLRCGLVTTQMVFEQGRKYLSYYDTSHGSVMVGVMASKVVAALTSAGGNITMEYGVEIDHSVAGENQLAIDVKEVAYNNHIRFDARTDISPGPSYLS